MNGWAMPSLEEPFTERELAMERAVRGEQVARLTEERDWHIRAHAEACRLGAKWRERAEAAEEQLKRAADR